MVLPNQFFLFCLTNNAWLRTKTCSKGAFRHTSLTDTILFPFSSYAPLSRSSFHLHHPYQFTGQTYESAVRDVTPPYFEMTVMSPSSQHRRRGDIVFGDEILVDGLPVGNIFQFVWNIAGKVCISNQSRSESMIGKDQTFVSSVNWNHFLDPPPSFLYPFLYARCILHAWSLVKRAEKSKMH